MKIHFKLLTDKIDLQGLCPIFVRSKLNGKEFKYFTGEKSKAIDWDNGKVRRTDKNYKRINECLDKVVRDIENFLHNCKLRGVVPTVQEIKAAISPTIKPLIVKSDTELFFDYFEMFLEYLKKKGAKESSVKHYAITRNHLRTWGEALTVSDYTDVVHNKYLDYLRTLRDYHPNHLDNQGRNLKTFFFWGRDNGVFKLSERHARLKKNYVEPERIWLTDSDLLKLSEVELSESLGRVRDTFLFGCYTGLRHSDLFRLTPEHILNKEDYKVISIVPQKSVSAMRTAKRVQIPLIPEAEALIEKYKGYSVKSLPILTNQRMNIYLKEIGRKAGLHYEVEVIQFEKSTPVIKLIPKCDLLTCHISRHTFATQSLIRGMKIEILQKILGHSNIKQTLTYAKVIDEFKEREMLKAWKK